MPNLIRQNHVFQMAGVGLPTEEYIRLTITMKELVRYWPVEMIRFWGKIFGRSADYYIVETEFAEGNYESDVSEDETSEFDSKSDMDKVH